MDKDIKNEFKKLNTLIENLAMSVENNVAKKEDLENFATKEDVAIISKISPFESKEALAQ